MYNRCGIVIGLSSSDERQGFLLVLEAKTFTELARARFQTKSSIPGTFHGLFVNWHNSSIEYNFPSIYEKF